MEDSKLYLINSLFFYFISTIFVAFLIIYSFLNTIFLFMCYSYCCSYRYVTIGSLLGVGISKSDSSGNIVASGDN